MRPSNMVVAFTLLLAALPAAAQQHKAPRQHEEDAAFLRVPAAEDGGHRIHAIRARVRHTTVIVLPAGERILDFVAGDAEYWHLTGAANVAYLKPLAEDAATNIALVCESGRIYSFLVAEHGDEPPHLVVRVEAGSEAGDTFGAGAPAFVARSEVAAYREMAAEAADQARRAREAAAAEIEAFRAAYPARLAFEYRLDSDASKRPFLVEAMWHDGRFTYLRSRAPEAPALYELKRRRAGAGRVRPEPRRPLRRPARAGRRLAPDRREAGRLAVRAGGRAMSRWKQWIKEPRGALPGGIVTKAGIALIGVLVAGMLLSSSLTDPEEDPTAPAAPEPRAVDERTGRAFDGRIRADTERHRQQAAADEDRADTERRRAETGEAAPGEAAESRTGGGGRGAGRGQGGHGPGRVRASRDAPARGDRAADALAPLASHRPDLPGCERGARRGPPGGRSRPVRGRARRDARFLRTVGRRPWGRDAGRAGERRDSCPAFPG